MGGWTPRNFVYAIVFAKSINVDGGFHSLGDRGSVVASVGRIGEVWIQLVIAIKDGFISIETPTQVSLKYQRWAAVDNPRILVLMTLAYSMKTIEGKTLKKMGIQEYIGQVKEEGR